MTHPRPPLAQALRSPELGAILPRLLAYARTRGADEVEDVVQDAVVLCLSGTWEWPEDLSLEGLLCGVIKSLVGHRRRHLARRPTAWLEDEGEAVAPSSRRLEALAARRRLAAVERVLQADPETNATLAILAGGAEKPAEIAAALGCTPEHASVIRRKMQRRLAAAGLRNGDDDERLEEHRPPRGAPASRRVSR